MFYYLLPWPPLGIFFHTSGHFIGFSYCFLHIKCMLAYPKFGGIGCSSFLSFLWLPVPPSKIPLSHGIFFLCFPYFVFFPSTNINDYILGDLPSSPEFAFGIGIINHSWQWGHWCMKQAAYWLKVTQLPRQKARFDSGSSALESHFIPHLAFSARWYLELRNILYSVSIGCFLALSRSLDLTLPESALAHPNISVNVIKEKCA